MLSVPTNIDFTENLGYWIILEFPHCGFLTHVFIHSANLRRTRSKSGSPPSRVGSSAGFRMGIQAGQPVSLPPIFTSNASSIDGLPTILSGSTSLTSGYSSMSSARSSNSGYSHPRSTTSKVDGKVSFFGKKNSWNQIITLISVYRWLRICQNPHLQWLSQEQKWRKLILMN